MKLTAFYSLIVFFGITTALTAQISQKIELEEGAMPPMFQAGTFGFVFSEPMPMGTVKGSPYSAEATTESVQVLSDGNRIVHKNSTQMFRDSEGRTRREQSFENLAGWTANGGGEKVVTIQDPIAQVSYVLDSTRHTARKISLPKNFKTAKVIKGDVIYAGAPVGMAGVEGGMSVTTMALDGAITKTGHLAGAAQSAESTVTESLGVKTFFGVSAEGTRTVTTIPAQAIGNESPIQITSEKWFSKDLQMVFLYTRKDPRFGETTFQITALQQAEPPRAQFEVPADYRMEDMPALPSLMAPRSAVPTQP